MPGDAPSDLHSIVKNVMSPRDALAVSGSSVFEVLRRDVSVDWAVHVSMRVDADLQ